MALFSAMYEAARLHSTIEPCFRSSGSHCATSWALLEPASSSSSSSKRGTATSACVYSLIAPSKSLFLYSSLPAALYSRSEASAGLDIAAHTGFSREQRATRRVWQ